MAALKRQGVIRTAAPSDALLPAVAVGSHRAGSRILEEAEQQTLSTPPSDVRGAASLSDEAALGSVWVSYSTTRVCCSQARRTRRRAPASTTTTAGIWTRIKCGSRSSSSCPREATTARGSSSTPCSPRYPAANHASKNRIE